MKAVILLAVILTLCVTTTMAQRESKTFSVGFGLEGGVPTGALADAYTFAAGLSLRFSYHVGPGFVTLTGGALGYDPKTVSGQSEKVGLEIPVTAGYKLIIHHFFVMGEVGYADFKTYYGENGNVVSTTTGSFIVVPSVGLNLGAFELGVRYGVDFVKGGNAGLFGVRIGFNF